MFVSFDNYRNSYFKYLCNSIEKNGVADFRGVLLVSSEKSNTAEVPDTDKVHFSPEAEAYLSGFRMELSDAINQGRLTPFPEDFKLNIGVSSIFEDIFRVFEKASLSGDATEYLLLYHISEQGLTDFRFDYVDYFPEITRAYETEYIKLNEKLISGTIGQNEYDKSLSAINLLYDDFIRQADMSAIFRPNGMEHPLNLLKEQYNTDYKQAFHNARNYIIENGSLEGVTGEMLSYGFTTTSFNVIQEMFSDEGKLLLFDSARAVTMSIFDDMWQGLLGRLKLSQISTGGKLNDNNDDTVDPEMLKIRLLNMLDDQRREISESTVSKTLKSILSMTLDWTIKYLIFNEEYVANNAISYLKYSQEHNSNWESVK